MKLLRFISLAVLLFGAFRSAAAGSPFRFDSDSRDWGVIREADGPVSQTFRLVNISGKPVCIYQVNVSCGCTKPEWSREVIAPGASSRIKVTFDPTGYKGRVSKTVSVLSSENTTDILTVSCEVIPVERPIEVAFPVLLECGLRLSADHISFGQICQGQARTMKVGIANASGKRLVVNAAPAGRSGLLSVVSSLVLEPGARDSLSLNFSLQGQKCRFGVIEDDVVLKCGKNICGRLPVSMIGTDSPASGTSDGHGPRLRVSSQYENLGVISRVSGPVSKNFELSNIGDSALIIRDIHTPRCIVPIKLSKTTLAPGEKVTVTIVLRPELSDKTKIFETVYVTANDAEHPVREIMIAATIRKQ